ncbi:UNVERIFIED_CONTAM: hypothetical protein GTU68_065668 [Idotea baltica]|nr:hypothetical protein [Idotea baltica]
MSMSQVNPMASDKLYSLMEAPILGSL